MKLMLPLVLLAVMIYSACAQINGSDPTLVLWLQATNLTPSDLSGVGVDGPYVTNWTDSSSYATIFVPPPLPSADTGTETNRTPQLITVTNNGDVFPAVQFLQANDPLSGGNNNYASRLWQTNNLGANDPTLIGTTNDLTLFFVYRNDDPNAALGPSQCIFAKRGPSACPYEFGLNVTASLISHMFITYAGQTVYPSTNTIPSQPEWGLVEMNATSAGVLTFKEYYASLGGWLADSQPVARGGDSVGVPVTLGFHVQGAGGNSSNPWGNGTYERFAGAVAEVALYNRSLSSNELGGIENSLLLKYFLQPGPPTLTLQPTNQTAVQFSSVSFSVVANGTPPFTYQWLKGGVPIPGANSARYTIPSVQLTDATNYSVIVSNSLSFTQSTNALLTVIPAAAPTLVSALRDYVDTTYVTVTFSQPVSAATAMTAANYGINNGVSISSVAVVTNSVSAIDTNYFSAVVLTTSGVTTSPSILTVNGIQNQAGTTIATNSQIAIPIPGAVVGAPPSANLLMWLKGDAAVYADSVGVYEWDDQSANANNVYASYGNAQVGQVAFPNAMHPAVNFNGTASLAINNSAVFQALTNFTMYIVGDVDNTKKSMEWLGCWSGFGLGISDGVAGRIKYVTYQPNNANDDIEPSSGADLGNRIPYLIEGSFVNYGQKSLYLNGTLVGSESTNSGININPGAVMTVGALAGGGTQPLVGDVVEVLIYSSVSPAQDAAIQNYLASKYFAPSTTLPTLVSATLSATQNTTVTVVFSEPVSAATATNASNYTINQGVTVSAATLVNSTTVVLTTSAIIPGAYTLTVNGVSDWAGNSIAAGSQIAITGIPAPQINIARQGSSLSITWNATAPYKLQSASSVNGPWSYVNSATSPYVVTPSQGSEFYRLSQ